MSNPADQDRWHRLSDLFHQALACAPEHRSQFLDGVARQDSALRDELESLLAFHAQSGGSVASSTRVVVTSPSLGSSDETLVGKTLNHYTITKKLGEGGMGVVYLAEDTRLGRPVALKSLAARFTQDVERRQRLRREARAAAALSHPNIATVHALEEIDGKLYVVSEYVPGSTLREEAAVGPLPMKTLLTTAVEIARALAAAHDQGVVHRDLKPENVMRTGDGNIKVLDFGLAYIRDIPDDIATTRRLTEPGAILGTPGYISPEQLRGAQVDFRADIFSFGVMLYELATGAHPFTSSNPATTIARVLETEPPSVADLSPGCPPALEQLIQRCLQKDPELRFVTTRELVEALELLRRDVTGASSPQSTPSRERAAEPASKPQSRSMWWWQCHQAVVGLVYYVTLVPMWHVRHQVSPPAGALLFFAAVAIVGVAGTVRFHLWFTSAFYPGELLVQRARVFWLTRIADGFFVVLLLASAGTIASANVAFGALLLGIAVGSLVALAVIEPATARAAFKRKTSRGGRKRSRKTASRRRSSRVSTSKNSRSGSRAPSD